jgi:hypothetical protein
MESYFLYGAIIITWLWAVTLFPIYEPNMDKSFYMALFYLTYFQMYLIFIGAAALVSLLVPTIRFPLLYAILVQVYVLTVLGLRTLLRDRPLKS